MNEEELKQELAEAEARIYNLNMYVNWLLDRGMEMNLGRQLYEHFDGAPGFICEEIEE